MNNCCTDYSEIRITIIKLEIYKPMQKRTNPGTGYTPESPELELSLMQSPNQNYRNSRVTE